MKTLTIALLVAAPLALGACATRPDDAALTAQAAAMLKASFKERGQAKLDRLDQDETQRLCSEWTGKAGPKDVAERIEQAKLSTTRWPADGRFLGDWKTGERIAQ